MYKVYEPAAARPTACLTRAMPRLNEMPTRSRFVRFRLYLRELQMLSPSNLALAGILFLAWVCMLTSCRRPFLSTRSTRKRQQSSSTQPPQRTRRWRPRRMLPARWLSQVPTRARMGRRSRVWWSRRVQPKQSHLGLAARALQFLEVSHGSLCQQLRSACLRAAC